MMKSNMMIALLAVAILAASCATTQIYDPETRNTGIRNTRTVSAEEMKTVAYEAIDDALNNPRFKRYLREYQVNKQTAEARPVLKLAQCVNDTDDPDLNVDQLTDLLNEALFNADVVDITLAEGNDRTDSIGNSRLNAFDPNFDQSTVAQQGTLIAANLVMRPKVISNTTQDGSTKDVVRTFTVDIADVTTGQLIWRYTRQLGFIKKRAGFGM
ncbi:MAG: penicillin-binding protein activator LpoB [Lentisphaeria bacterium]|nr:penicillin-binding protein activator LpoB [Lentisphaeria bacterium]